MDRILKKAGLTETVLDELEAEIIKIEKKSRGEIVIAISLSSHNYAVWELLFGICVALLVFIGGMIFFNPLHEQIFKASWGYSQPLVLVAFVGSLIFFTIGVFFLIANIPAIDRLIVPKWYKKEAVYKRAVGYFVEGGIYAAQENAGVLLYISLLEREVCIIADKGIYTKVQQSQWDSIAHIIASGFKKPRHAPDAIFKALAEMNLFLTEHFPATEQNPDDIANRVVLLNGGE